MDSYSSQDGFADTSSKVGGMVDAAKDKAGKFAEQGGQLKDKTVDVARAQVKSALGSSKERAASTLTHMGDAVRSSGRQLEEQGHSHLGRYADVVADGVGSVSGYLNDRSIDDVVGDAEDLARRKPALFISGALALGILAGRFLKSSTPGPSTDWREAAADTR